MIVNPDKFQLICLQQSIKQLIQEKLPMDNNKIEFEDSVTLLCITVDNRLSFDDYILKLYNKVFM